MSTPCGRLFFVWYETRDEVAGSAGTRTRTGSCLARSIATLSNPGQHCKRSAVLQICLSISDLRDEWMQQNNIILNPKWSQIRKFPYDQSGLKPKNLRRFHREDPRTSRRAEVKEGRDGWDERDIAIGGYKGESINLNGRGIKSKKSTIIVCYKRYSNFGV